MHFTFLHKTMLACTKIAFQYHIIYPYDCLPEVKHRLIVMKNLFNLVFILKPIETHINFSII